MPFIRTAIPDVVIFEPKVFGDDRGFFMETFRENVFEEEGLLGPFVQDNHSSSHRGVLRGLHYQIPPEEVAKLVRVVRGKAFDVAVDLRVKSPTYGQWVGEILSEENRRMMYVPRGFAHGFLALEDGTEFLYKMSGYYSPSHEKGIMYNDENLNIEWPSIEGDYTISEKDKVNLTFSQYQAEPDFPG